MLSRNAAMPTHNNLLIYIVVLRQLFINMLDFIGGIECGLSMPEIAFRRRIAP